MIRSFLVNGENAENSPNEEQLFRFDSNILVILLKYHVGTISIGMRYRSKTDIIASMLEAARNGGTKTKIMYSSFLSYHQLRSYLELVISNNLLAYDSTKELYKTTDRGLGLLDLYKSMGMLEI
jgi:predicted transcriptional regulator